MRRIFSPHEVEEVSLSFESSPVLSVLEASCVGFSLSYADFSLTGLSVAGLSVAGLSVAGLSVLCRALLGFGAVGFAVDFSGAGSGLAFVDVSRVLSRSLVVFTPPYG